MSALPFLLILEEEARAAGTFLDLRPELLQAVPVPLTLISLINSSCALFVCHFPLFLWNHYLWRGGGEVVEWRQAGRQRMSENRRVNVSVFP